MTETTPLIESAAATLHRAATQLADALVDLEDAAGVLNYANRTLADALVVGASAVGELRWWAKFLEEGR